MRTGLQGSDGRRTCGFGRVHAVHRAWGTTLGARGHLRLSSSVWNVFARCVRNVADPRRPDCLRPLGGIQNAIGNLAGVIAPALTGLLIENTQRFTAAFLLAAIVSVLGLIGWVWMVPRLAPLPGPPSACRRSRAGATDAPVIRSEAQPGLLRHGAPGCHPAASVRSTAPESFSISSDSSVSRVLYGGATMIVSPITPPT